MSRSADDINKEAIGLAYKWSEENEPHTTRQGIVLATAACTLASIYISALYALGAKEGVEYDAFIEQWMGLFKKNLDMTKEGTILFKKKFGGAADSVMKEFEEHMKAKFGEGWNKK